MTVYLTQAEAQDLANRMRLEQDEGVALMIERGLSLEEILCELKKDGSGQDEVANMIRSELYRRSPQRLEDEA